MKTERRQTHRPASADLLTTRATNSGHLFRGLILAVAMMLPAWAMAAAPQVNNSTGASNVQQTTATLNGTLVDTGGLLTEARVYWGETDGGTVAGDWDHSATLGTQPAGSLSFDLTNLKTSTTYFFRFFATNADGDAWASPTADFTTLSAEGPAPVFLGEAEHFTILAGTAITTTGGGTVNGDVGLYPGPGSSIGIPPPQVNGTIYARDATGTDAPNVVIDDALLLRAKNDLQTAMVDAAGRAADVVNPGSGNLGGLTLVAGVYKTTTTTNISGSDLTLSGGPEDVWIFMCDQNLVVASDRQVILSGGAQAKNVYWQVTSGATIGTGASFKGTILADTGVTMFSTSTIEGRAMSFSADVVFDGTDGSLPSQNLEVDLDANDSNGTTGFDYDEAFLPGGPAVALADPIDATVTDANYPDIASLTITGSGILDSGNEIVTIGGVAFPQNLNLIDSSVTKGTTTFRIEFVTLTKAFAITNDDGSRMPLDDVNSLLRDMTYENIKAEPTSGTRTFTYVADNGTTTSEDAVSTITVNDPPVIDLDANDSGGTSGADYARTFNAGGPAVPLSDPIDATITDTNDTTMLWLTIAGEGIQDGANEIVTIGGESFTQDADKTATVIKGVTTFQVAYLLSTGVFTVTNDGGGEMLLADLKTLLRDLTYQNTKVIPTLGLRTFTFTANDGDADSNEAVSTITINDTPIAVADDITVAEGGTATSLTTGPGFTSVLVNDTDTVGEPLEAILVTGVTEGTLTLNSDGTFSYTHDGGETTSDSFTYKANDGALDSNVVTVTITVTPVNDAPVALDDAYIVDEGGTLTTVSPGVLANDTDAEGDALTATVVTTTINGLLTLQLDGSFTYVHDGSETTADSFTYVANDGTVDSNEATVSITVSPVNDAPVAVADEYTTAEDITLNVDAPGVLANDTDAEGDPLTAVLVEGVSHGTLALNSNGSFSYTPTANYNGSDSFTYKNNDGILDSNIVTVTLTITAVNDPPVAVDDAYTVTPGGTRIVAAPGVLVNDTDIDGDTLAAVLVSTTSNGALTLTSDGAFTYTHDGMGSTTDSFTYRANDGTTDSDIATVSFTISVVNTAPDAVDDAMSVAAGGTVSVLTTGPGNTSVLDNDTDAEGSTLTAAIDTLPTNGTLTLNPNGTFSYTHDGGVSTTDSFTYIANDGELDSNLATVTITITAANEAPVAVEDSITVAEGGTATLLANGPGYTSVLVNDTDAEMDTLTAKLVTGVTHGVLTLNSDGTFSYTHDGGETTSDSFTYKANDGELDSNTVTVSITVTPVNDAPVAVDDAYTVAQSGTLTISSPGVLVNDTDAEDSPLSASLETGVSNGVLSFNTDGSFSYTPTSGFSGEDTFTYLANDGELDSNPATVTITVTPVNSAPVAVADAYNTPEDTTLNVAADGVLGNDSDIDGDTLTSILVANVSHGVLSLQTDGSFSYTPTANYNGSDSFTYKANDGVLDSNVVTVDLTIDSVPDAPVAVADAYSMDENARLTVVEPGVLGNDTDADGDPLTAVLVTDVSHGSLALAQDGSFTYTPTVSYNGSDSFVYMANDGALNSNQVTVTITIAAINDAPVAVADSYEAIEGVALNVEAPGLLANDTDVEGDALTAVLATNVSNGTLSLNPDGSFTYTPNPGYNGQDSFTYYANDGFLDSNTVTVTLTIAAGDLVIYKGRSGRNLIILIGYHLSSGNVTEFHAVHWLEYGRSGRSRTYRLLDEELGLPAALYDTSDVTAILNIPGSTDITAMDSLLATGVIRSFRLQNSTIQAARLMRGHRIRVVADDSQPEAFQLIEEHVVLRLNRAATNYFLRGISSDGVAADAVLSHYLDLIARFGYTPDETQ